MVDKPAGKPTPSPWQALGIVWDLLLAIAVPTVVFGLGGRWLDSRFGTSPLFVILGLFLSLAIVLIIVNRKAKDIAKRI